MKAMAILITAASILPTTVPAYEKAFKSTPPGIIEVKTLPARTVMMTEGKGNYFESNNGMFGTLFRFIKLNDVAMTVPVKADVEPGRMYFYLGTDETYRDLIAMEGVEVRSEPEQVVMSIGFRGSYSQSNFLKARDALLAQLGSSREWSAAGAAYAVFWNGPYVPGFMKKFEVHVPLKPMDENGTSSES
jgi:hypothetical protein